MSTRFLNIACLLGALGVFSLAANARNAVVRASVPFEFAAGGAMMPPGEYTVDILDFSGSIILRGPSGNSVALLTMAADPTPASNKSTLHFERRDGVAFLAGVEWPDQSVRLTAPFMHVSKGPSTASLH